MADEQTLATEVRTFFQALAREPNRGMGQALAETVNTNIGSIQFFQVLASTKSSCDQLVTDINASGLKQGSKSLYLGAVNTLANYISISSLNGASNHMLRAEVKAFEYLTLVDDFLEPLDKRDISADFLEKISDQAHSMLNGLEESDIDHRLKAFLVKQVRQFIWSIQTFKIVGIEGLTRAWGSMAAEIARSQGMHGARKPEAEGWYKKALPILGAIGLAVTSASATVEKADNLLTHGGHIVSVVTGHEVEAGATAANGSEEKAG